MTVYIINNEYLPGVNLLTLKLPNIMRKIPHAAVAHARLAIFTNEINIFYMHTTEVTFLVL